MMRTPSVFRHSPDSPWTYRLLDQYQQRTRARVIAGGPGEVIFSEVSPVVTLGRRMAIPLALRQGEHPVYPTGRGGLETYHGPGQWVMFVVERLERLTGDRRGVRRAVEGLLEVGLQAVRTERGDAEIRSDCWGIWGPEGKIASVGVDIRDGVLMHGLAVNVFRTGPSFEGVRPCGLDAQPAYVFEGSFDEGLFLDFRERLEGALWSVFPKLLNFDQGRGIGLPSQSVGGS